VGYDDEELGGDYLFWGALGCGCEVDGGVDHLCCFLVEFAGGDGPLFGDVYHFFGGALEDAVADFIAVFPVNGVDECLVGADLVN
jgi:hypothetical protein